MKFAFLIMGDFNIEADRASIHDGTARIVGVASIGEAKEEALRLKRKGVGYIGGKSFFHALYRILG